jgi:phenylacetate-CoA ligase
VTIWDAAETLPREQLEILQLERLGATVARVLAGQPLGAERLAQAGVRHAGDITTLADIKEVPFFVKADLRENYPFGLLAVPREQLVRVHASSGTHGRRSLATRRTTSRRGPSSWPDR